MKKIYLIILIALIARTTNAQNILFFQDFETDVITDTGTLNLSNGIWLNKDFDGLPDQSGANPGRADGWVTGPAFATIDNGNTVLFSNSWTNVPTEWVSNYIITPPIYLQDSTGVLTWRSAPVQTPRFLDGMQVLVSTSGTSPEDFTDTLFLYAECIDGIPNTIDSSSLASTFASYSFTDGYIFGLDSTYIEDHGDALRYRGILRPDTASLKKFAGQTIYIAFCHGTHDDDEISIDDIQVTGNGTVSTNDIKENLNVNVFPNPAIDKINVSYKVSNVTSVKLNIYDVTGKLIKAIANVTQLPGNYNFNVDVKDLPAGLYHIQLQSPHGESTVQVTKF